MKVGDRIKAKTEIADFDICQQKRHVHAQVGDLGTIIRTYMSPDLCPIVRFDLTGTTTMVAPIEVEVVTKEL